MKLLIARTAYLVNTPFLGGGLINRANEGVRYLPTGFEVRQYSPFRSRRTMRQRVRLQMERQPVLKWRLRRGRSGLHTDERR